MSGPVPGVLGTRGFPGPSDARGGATPVPGAGGPPEILARVAEIARGASRVLLSHFGASHEALGVESKADDSPVSRADRESDDHLRDALALLLPDVPAISEEASLPAFGERSGWPRFLLVDPLDGTKEFLRGSPDFTVNVALVENGRPLWGVIHVSVEDRMVVGWRGLGAWISEPGDLGSWRALAPLGSAERAAECERRLAGTAGGDGLRAVLSQSHRHGSEDAALARFGLSSLVRRGSSLKFLLVATGEVDVYFRRTPTWEWDTAAGQAIVEAAGGIVCDAAGEPLRCNKETPLNGPFLACPAPLKEACLERIRRAAAEA